MQRVSTRTGYCLMAVVSMVSMVAAALPTHTSATTVNAAPTAKVSFTFDDGLDSTYTQALPVLSAYGLTGTVYAITGCVGMTTAPNTCRANNDTTYMTWAQLQDLQNTHGWEIGSHTVTHRCLASSRATGGDDCQLTQLTPTQVDTELVQSKNTLTANGLNVTAFSAPYGDYSNQVLAQIAKYYSSMRGFKDINTNVWPYNEYLTNNYPVQEAPTSVADAKAKIDDAIANNTWLVLTFHDVVLTPSTNPDAYQYGTAELDQIAQYVADKQAAGQIISTNVSKGIVASDTNLLPNASFNNGIADGWQTDDATNITADSGSNGSYPDAVKAIKLVSPGSGQSHLFSPKVAIDPYTTYMFKNFLNLQAITDGQVAFYMDEYDAAGNWVSGQYLKQETAAFVENMNFTYKPTSVAVSKAALQVIVAGTGITAYLDNAQTFPVSSTTATNLVVNGMFDNGIADGWTTDDPTNITADSANHGGPANPEHAVAMVAGASGNTHLFSQRVSVAQGQNYSVNVYLNMASIASGEVGLYIDEYDSNGNWVSGHYITGVQQTGAGNIGFTYTPSSADVATASLQVIVVDNSNISAYFDDVKWYQN